MDLANEICDGVTREICLSSICSIKAVYLRRLNTGNSLLVKMHNPPANQRGVISSVGMESSFPEILQDGE